MKTLITAVALATLVAAPAFTQYAFAANEATISLSLADIIAILLFVPLGVLFADRLVRGKSAAADVDADADATVRLQLRPDAGREGSDRYDQVIGDLKRSALQPKRLAESERQREFGDIGSERSVDDDKKIVVSRG